MVGFLVGIIMVRFLVGIVTRLAGGGGKGCNSGYADGTGTAAMFSWPLSAVASTSGIIYVADSANNVIRILSAAGDRYTYAIV